MRQQLWRDEGYGTILKFHCIASWNNMHNGVFCDLDNYNKNVIMIGVMMILITKHRETHGCVVRTVASDALVLKYQAISIHNAD